MANDAKLVFSTDGRGDTRKVKDAVSKSSEKTSTSHGGTVKMRLESAGRGGKQVTVLFSLPFSESEAQKIMKDLQGKLGTGGTFKNSKMEFRGDMRDRVEELLTKQGLKVVRAGG